MSYLSESTWTSLLLPGTPGGAPGGVHGGYPPGGAPGGVFLEGLPGPAKAPGRSRAGLPG